MSLLTVDRLAKSYGAQPVIQGLSFTVEPGLIQSIIGPNGAGKTTLFNLISGLATPSAGTICFAGRPITGLPVHRIAALGLARTFQNVQPFFNLTARENVMLGQHLTAARRLLPALLRLPSLRRAEAAATAEADRLLAFVGLERYAEAQAGALPYGAIKRLDIARALAMRPKLLLLDEPAAGLNPSETDGIRRLIRAVAETGVTILLVEHDMKLVRGVSDQILVINHGQRLAEGRWQEIRHDPQVIEAYLGHGGRHD